MIKPPELPAQDETRSRLSDRCDPKVSEVEAEGWLNLRAGGQDSVSRGVFNVVNRKNSDQRGRLASDESGAPDRRS